MDEEELLLDEDELFDEEETGEIELPTRTYKVVDGRIAGFADGGDAMEQALRKILLTSRFEHEIYSENYGHDLEDFIGEDFEYIEEELERYIEEALITDERVESVENFVLEKINKNSLFVHFVAVTAFGEIDLETEVQI